MTDKEKLEAIKAEIERLKLCTINEHMKFYSEAAEGEYNAFKKVLEIINSLPEEPVSGDFEMALAEMIDKAQKCVVEPLVVAEQWKDELIKLAKSEEPVSKVWHGAYELSEDVKMNKGYYHIVERLCLCVNHKGDAAIGWIEVDGDDVACCSPHLISTLLLAEVYYYAYIDELFPQKLADEIKRNIMNDKSY